jgi:choline dehydrogenase-like flavoprotein
MAAREPFDVCVIGTGAGGGVMLQELTRAGFSVVALERGPQLEASQFMSDDELAFVIRDEVFSPHQIETWRPDEATLAVRGHYNMIAHCVGGTLTHWAAWSWRFRPDEFKVLSSEGPLAGASLADWPVDYDEMEPWYQRAEWEFGVSGRGGANPFEGSRKKGYPNPAHPPRATTPHVERIAKKLGYTSFPVPMAINSQPYDGRSKCMYGGACQQYGCPIHAKGTTFSIHVPRALATGRLDLRPDARATEIRIGKDGRAQAVRYLDRDGHEQEVHARRVVVAAGTLGTPHLLLMSKSGAFPQGLANSSGQVGRNLMFHHFAAANFTLESETRMFTGLEATVAIDDLHPSDPKRGFIRGGVIADANALTKQPLAWVFQGLGGQGRGWGADFKRRLRDFPRIVPLVAILEDLPMESNRLDLDPDVVDDQGLPALRITHRQHPNDIAMNRWFTARLLEMADAAGARQKWEPISPFALVDEKSAMPGSVHLHGTSRMGDDPTKSVVDRWCRSHDVPNLWVVDCGVFPTSGGYNPTLTLLAMAYRAADRMIAEAKRQNA